MSSIVERLTEGVVNRDMRAESHALLSKWKKTGLLEGLDTERQANSMARLLENQAKELLRESTTMSSGDVEGFAAVAFPIVRRVFAGLIANDLVSVQPMSLPSGLIFFLDSSTSPSLVISVELLELVLALVTKMLSQFTVPIRLALRSLAVSILWVLMEKIYLVHVLLLAAILTLAQLLLLKLLKLTLIFRHST
jgi:hypothetical protein